MVILLNILYNGSSCIVKINFDGKPNIGQIQRDVKSHFKIMGKIKFKDEHVAISDEFLEDYVSQYSSTPGWRLLVEDVTEEKNNNESIEFEIEELLDSSHVYIEREEYTEPQHSTETVLIEEVGSPKVSAIIDSKILKNFDDLDFKIILKSSSKNFLENCDRIKISKIIVKYVLQNDVNIELNRGDFLYLADLVNKVLPSELPELYYSPSRYGQKASGKLYDAYNNYRKRLSEIGLLKRRPYSLKQANSLTSPDSSDDILYVKLNSSPTKEFVRKWNNCLKERQNLLRSPSTTTYDFIKQFPIFNTDDNFVFTLLKSDVISTFPSFEGIETWNLFYQKVFQKLSLINDRTAQNFLKLAEDISEESKKSVAFLLLPYLFPSTVLRATCQNNKKLTKIEVQEKFISHFDTIEQADIAERNNVELQPKIVFVANFNDLKVYVTLVDKIYYFDNPLDAVESCFFIYMGLNIKYSKETKMVWNFIQKYVFKITTQYDLNNSSIRSVYYKLLR